MEQPEYRMEGPQRHLVLEAIVEVCDHRGWELAAAQVRTQHVHVVVHGPEDPIKARDTFKAYASRHLNEAGLDNADRKRWGRQGSVRALWSEAAVERAVEYVLFGQGEPMETYPPLGSDAAQATYRHGRHG